ncbi:unnamed protein product [Arabidopsis thaliana]|uniref:Uncharacterized protein n=2 Tax=Arabidopsis TaxID=3701 RepID=A0A5S9XJL2_ARATH|nr:hypothetical protein ISN44_As03g041580 [Arabidopsis suecica]CAA0385425.1 unnamed protein product [Arabidopsis thaliana]VYS59933.1 unnamed protein product [Arabidopsis thaliana]
MYTTQLVCGTWHDLTISRMDDDCSTNFESILVDGSQLFLCLFSLAKL